jgi:hypothetical membrane protein
MSLANYVLVGLFTDEIDQYYITSWKIFVGMAVVFNVLSPLAYAMLRHRLGQKTFFICLWETIKWTPMVSCGNVVSRNLHQLTTK